MISHVLSVFGFIHGSGGAEELVIETLVLLLASESESELLVPLRFHAGGNTELVNHSKILLD